MKTKPIKEYGLKITTKKEILKIDDDDYLNFIKNKTEFIKYERGFIGVKRDLYEMKEHFIEKENKDRDFNQMGTILNERNVILGDVLIFFQTQKDFNKYYKFWGEFIKTL